jgi:hypothetical protein
MEGDFGFAWTVGGRLGVGLAASLGGIAGGTLAAAGDCSAGDCGDAEGGCGDGEGDCAGAGGAAAGAPASEAFIEAQPGRPRTNRNPPITSRCIDSSPDMPRSYTSRNGSVPLIVILRESKIVQENLTMSTRMS